MTADQEKINRNERKLRRLRFISRWATYCAMMFTSVAFLYIGPRVESELFPVVTAFEITKVEHIDADHTAIWGVLSKPAAKSQCELVSLTITTTDYKNPDKVVNVQFEPNDKFDTRPPGSQEFGPWILEKPAPPVGPFIIFRSIHRCHFAWPSETHLYTGLTKDFFPANSAEIKEENNE